MSASATDIYDDLNKEHIGRDIEAVHYAVQDRDVAAPTHLQDKVASNNHPIHIRSRESAQYQRVRTFLKVGDLVIAEIPVKDKAISRASASHRVVTAAAIQDVFARLAQQPVVPDTGNQQIIVSASDQ